MISDKCQNNLFYKFRTLKFALIIIINKIILIRLTWINQIEKKDF